MSGQGMLGGLIGPGVATPNLANRSTSATNSQGNLNYANQVAAQQQLMNQYNRALSPKWVIDGRVMSIEEFGKEMFGEDTAELTFFLLKYKDIEEKKT